MTNIKLNPAFSRQLKSPRVGGFEPPPEKPEPPRQPWWRLVAGAVVCMVVGAGVVASWMFVTHSF